MKDGLTQEKMVLNFMKENGSITSMEAFNYFNITRLSARIFNLRSAGHNIDTEQVEGKNAFGHYMRYARYRLIGEEDNGNIQSREE